MAEVRRLTPRERIDAILSSFSDDCPECGGLGVVPDEHPRGGMEACRNDVHCAIQNIRDILDRSASKAQSAGDES